VNGLVGALAALIEQIASPTDNLGLSEVHSLRLGVLLRDSEFENALANAKLGPDDVQSLSFDSWVWYLNWRSERAPSPSSKFLDALFEASAEPIVRYSVVESVVRSAQRESPELVAGAVRSVDELQMDWLRRQFAAIVSEEVRSDAPNLGSRREREERALELASYLLDVGVEPAYTAIRALVNERWQGRQQLIGRLSERLGDYELGEEARLEWLQRLGLVEER
jgi:hypothetical protein